MALALARRPPKYNAVKSGAFAASQLLPWEDHAARAAMAKDLRDYITPSGAAEERIVSSMAAIMWRGCRLEQAEAALVRVAVEQAEKNPPPEIRRLAEEVHRSEVELRLLCKVLHQAQSQTRMASAKQFLTGMASVLDAVLAWPCSIADMEAARAVQKLAEVVSARRRALRAARGQLTAARRALRTTIQAAVMEASLLPEGLAERLRKERVSIERSLIRGTELLLRMRGLHEMTGRSAAGEVCFSKTKLGTPGSDSRSSIRRTLPEAGK